MNLLKPFFEVAGIVLVGLMAKISMQSLVLHNGQLNDFGKERAS